MKIKLLIENSNNYADYNYQFIIKSIKDEKQEDFLGEDKERDLLNIINKESLLVKNKIIKKLGIGGMNIVFELENGMVLRLFFAYKDGDRVRENLFFQESQQNMNNYKKQYDEKPEKMVIYSAGHSDKWTYTIINKIYMTKRDPIKSLEKNKYQTYQPEGSDKRELLPEEILSIFDGTLGPYEDADIGAGILTDYAGGNFQLKSELSIPRKIIKKYVDMGRPDVDNISNLIYNWHKKNFWQFRQLDLEEVSIAKEYIKEYVRGNLEGYTDFKSTNIGQTSTGQITWFDKLKRPTRGEALVQQRTNPYSGNYPTNRRTPKEFRGRNIRTNPGSSEYISNENSPTFTRIDRSSDKTPIARPLGNQDKTPIARPLREVLEKISTILYKTLSTRE